MQNGQLNESNGFHPNQNNDRPAKRARLAADSFASIQQQLARADTSLEVDHMTLDYIAYQTIRACLSSRKTSERSEPSHNLASNLAMSSNFLAIFKHRHPYFKPDAELRFRLLVLRLTTLFTQRLTENPTTPSKDDLETLRLSNQERARRWIGRAICVPTLSHDVTMLDEELPIPAETLDRNRAHVLHQLDIPAEDELYQDAFYGTSSSISLLDLIPLFMQVSAARNAMSVSNLSETWMELACELMLQACLEQYLVCGAHGSDAIDEAFAWGYKDSERVTEDGSFAEDPNEIEVMFEDEDYEAEVASWPRWKSQYLTLLFPPSSPGSVPEEDAKVANNGIGLTSFLEIIASTHRIDGFETSFLTFLLALHDSIPKPVLVQLEDGQLEGMSKLETQTFLATCGVGTVNFFHTPAGFKGSED